MAKNSGKLKRAERRAPAPHPKIELPTDTTEEEAPPAAAPYKPYQHSAALHSTPTKKITSSTTAQANGKHSRAKREKAIARADKINSKFLTNKAKAERKKLMKS